MCEGHEGDTRVTQEGRTNSGRLRSVEICLSRTIFPVGAASKICLTMIQVLGFINEHL
jgi:hypothetical protein